MMKKALRVVVVSMCVLVSHSAVFGMDYCGGGPFDRDPCKDFAFLQKHGFADDFDKTAETFADVMVHWFPEREHAQGQLVQKVKEGYPRMCEEGLKYHWVLQSIIRSPHDFGENTEVQRIFDGYSEGQANDLIFKGTALRMAMRAGLQRLNTEVLPDILAEIEKKLLEEKCSCPEQNSNLWAILKTVSELDKQLVEEGKKKHEDVTNPGGYVRRLYC